MNLRTLKFAWAVQRQHKRKTMLLLMYSHIIIIIMLAF